ncbi:fused MFS/spermidine synthase [Ferruginibacter lapsinanis]|uniref:fused MFS/spermidine synthase n=1 Tax=Ferruginibacter lapsinanis TaxID=563172 RepID=UPI001E3A271D|nr:fused MFS/spermidine synthase [Ferruginibacter lapsinanis]UEG49390.1 fused MFS/spermidine synthase [Ferruginibacter lapsinanis]
MMKKIGLFIIVLLIEGGALMAVELMGAKLMAPFFGTSLYVWTAVLCITVLGLSLGYYLGGIFSQKRPSEELLFTILGIAAILVYALPYTASFAIAVTKNIGLLPGICIASVLLLVPPMVCFGIVGPMVVRLMTAQLKTLGKTAGAVYFTSTLGGIIVTFLFGFYLIPEKGLKYCSIVAAVSLAVLPVLYLIIRLISGNKADQQMIVAESVVVLESSKTIIIKANRSIYLFAVLEGAAVMAIELIVARMMAPYFGSSLYVWGAVIGATLISLAAGYYLGGYLGDKYVQLNILFWMLLIASVFLLLLHYLSQHLVVAFENATDTVSALVIVSVLLVLPPLLFLGMVPTLLIRYLSAKVADGGKTTGTVYTISSISGIVALFLIGFFIIPAYGLTVPSIWIGFIVGIVPFVKLIMQKKYIALLFIAALLFSVSVKKVEESSPDVEIQYFSEGLLGQVLVADVHKVKQDNIHSIQTDDRILFVNRMGQTFVNKRTGVSNWNYISFTSAIASKLPENSKVLLLGLGGGSVANTFCNLKFSVDAIELDERISDVAQDYFSLNPNVEIIIDDARHYIEKTTNKYDLIFFDVFKGDIPPAHVLTSETFLQAKKLLNKDGFIAVNFNGFLTGDIGIPGRSVYKTLTAAGLHTYILPTPGKEDERNCLFIAGQTSLDFNNLRSPLLHGGIPVPIDSLLFDPKQFNQQPAVVFVDDIPNLDLLNIKAGNSWRKGYIKGYTKMFLENGIPLFK